MREIFEDELDEPIGNIDIDPEGIAEDINISEIEDYAKNKADEMVSNIKGLHFDSDYWIAHPLAKQRIDAELESLRILIKMRKADEISHDLCLRNIGMNSGNASLYTALTKTQANAANLTKQIEEVLKNITVFCKGIQLEFDFEQKQNNSDLEDFENTGTASRGSKKFIQQMQEEMNE